MTRLIISIVSVIALLSGIVLLVSPIPFGALLIAVSLSTLIYSNTSVQNVVKRLRRNYQTFNEKITWVENKVGDKAKFISQSLIKTRPEMSDPEWDEKQKPGM
jgi:hypothetical protein